jgi:hypothetical protein
LTPPSQAVSYPFGNKKGVVLKTTPKMGTKKAKQPLYHQRLLCLDCLFGQAF